MAGSPGLRRVGPIQDVVGWIPAADAAPAVTPHQSCQQRRQATSDMMLMSATIPAGSGAAGAACASPGTIATMKPATAIPKIVRNVFLSRIWPVARGFGLSQCVPGLGDIKMVPGCALEHALSDA